MQQRIEVDVVRVGPGARQPGASAAWDAFVQVLGTPVERALLIRQALSPRTEAEPVPPKVCGRVVRGC